MDFINRWLHDRNADETLTPIGIRVVEKVIEATDDSNLDEKGLADRLEALADEVRPEVGHDQTD